jgi:hypothetical protein
MAVSGEESVTAAELLRRIETWKLLARYWSALALSAERGEHEGDAERLEIADREANEAYRMAKMLEGMALSVVTG